MTECIKLDQLNKELDFFHKMYDSVRLVDPVHKKVLDYRGSSIHCTNEVCYNYWGNKKICENCISIRAYNEKKSFMKLEKTSDKVFVVTALPIEDTNNPVVLELLKDGTDTMFIGSGDYNSGESLNSYVNKINDMVIKDSVTNLYNRRFVNERLPVDIINATLKKQPLSLCFVDLDNFKILNDINGHKIGDLVLRKVSKIITKNIRSGLDWASRRGGDEFLLCLNNTDEKQATIIMECIQDEIKKLPNSLGIESPCFSISFGVKTMSDTPITAEELIHLADQLMYEHKKKKHNN